MRKTNTLLILIAVIFSCKPYKNYLKSEGGKYDAMENIIIDYYHSNKKYIKKYSVFEIAENNDLDNADFYYLKISPRNNYYYLSSKDSIGAVPNNFPTNYKEYKGRLFVWNDKNKSVSQNILNKLHSYNKLDSIRLKYKLGIYSINDTKDLYPEVPVFTIDESLKQTYYIVCKKQINNYDKFWNESELENLILSCK